jgi:hypothetical protein
MMSTVMSTTSVCNGATASRVDSNHQVVAASKKVGWISSFNAT